MFVLHAFCVASFCELWSLCGGIAGWVPLMCMPLGGLLGAAWVLGLVGLLYVGLQVYVYVSFSVSFS